MSSRPNIVELLANPKRAATLAERERAARRGAPGWLGSTARDNPQTALMIDGVREIEVHPRSSGYTKGHLRTGYMMIGGIETAGREYSLEDFERERFPAGTEVGIEYYDPNATGRRARRRSTYFKLSKWPRVRPWETRPRVEPGERA